MFPLANELAFLTLHRAFGPGEDGNTYSVFLDLREWLLHRAFGPGEDGNYLGEELVAAEELLHRAFGPGEDGNHNAGWSPIFFAWNVAPGLRARGGLKQGKLDR